MGLPAWMGVCVVEVAVSLVGKGLPDDGCDRGRCICKIKSKVCYRLSIRFVDSIAEGPAKLLRSGDGENRF